MRNIIVSDIFGRTSSLENIAAEICSRAKGKTEILDPYDAKSMVFKNEEEAYQAFTSKVGLDKYANILKTRILSMQSIVRVVAFSAGASALWRLTDQPVAKKISCATLFYGSQIRNFTDVDPTIPTRLIFPKSEPHFDVAELIAILARKKNVEVEQTEFLHGFMNPHSLNFEQIAYTRYLNKLLA